MQAYAAMMRSAVGDGAALHQFRLLLRALFDHPLFRRSAQGGALRTTVAQRPTIAAEPLTSVGQLTATYAEGSSDMAVGGYLTATGNSRSVAAVGDIP